MAYSFYLNVAFNDTFVFERPFRCNFNGTTASLMDKYLLDV